MRPSSRQDHGSFEVDAAEKLRSDCFMNLTAEEQEELFQNEQSHRLERIQKEYFGIYMIPFAVVGLLLSCLYIFVVYKAIRSKKVSRKAYIFLLNRTVGDLGACITALALAGYVLLSDTLDNLVITTMDTFFAASLYAAMASYVLLSAMKLFAVARPFAYRNFVTLRRCVYLLILSWVAFFYMIVSTLSVLAITQDPILQTWTGCKLETCVRNLFRRRKIFILISYFLTLVVFLITVLLVRRSQIISEAFRRASLGDEHFKSELSVKPVSHNPNPKAVSHVSSLQLHSDYHIRAKHARFPMWKLSINVATFAGLHSVLAIWCIATLIVTDRCYFFIHYADMMFWLGLVRLTLVIRIIVDPLLAFATDVQIRRTLFSVTGLNTKLSWLSKSSGKPPLTEWNSSEAVISTRSRTSGGCPKNTVITISHTPSSLPSIV